ncbi:DNA repair protein RadC [candidate division WS5 bacterium]|uniref:DNA repair protein RadC n=1 Tax=candidate division WS5 bacterium TaxID=2093353 RepID=A0A419D9W9_9BACT|nr:MAG: DNA repair protein RadC [candidate division WS5 bacterium]
MKNAKCLRLRIIRPVFEDIAISELSEKYFHGKSIRNSRDIYELFSHLSRETKEHFIAIHLDTKNRIICVDTISIGSLTSSIVHPREVFKSVLLSSAASIALVHNHPSGAPEPSRDDIDITTRLKEAGNFLGIPVIDHIIIGNGSYISLIEKGYF